MPSNTRLEANAAQPTPSSLQAICVPPASGQPSNTSMPVSNGAEPLQVSSDQKPVVAGVKVKKTSLVNAPPLKPQLGTPQSVLAKVLSKGFEPSTATLALAQVSLAGGVASHATPPILSV